MVLPGTSSFLCGGTYGYGCGSSQSGTNPNNQDEELMDEATDLPVCDYDDNPTPLYCAMERHAWGAVNRFLKTGVWPGDYFSDRNPPKKQVRTWIHRYDTGIHEIRDEDVGGGSVSTGTIHEGFVAPIGGQIQTVAAAAQQQSPPTNVHVHMGRPLRWRQLPLHAALIFLAPPQIVRQLIEAFPYALRCPDDKGMLPLHLAFRQAVPDDVLHILLRLFPNGMHVRDSKGRLPVECVREDIINNETSPPLRGMIIQSIMQQSKDKFSKQQADTIIAFQKDIQHLSNKMVALEQHLMVMDERERSTREELSSTLNQLSSLQKDHRKLQEVQRYSIQKQTEQAAIDKQTHSFQQHILEKLDLATAQAQHHAAATVANSPRGVSRSRSRGRSRDRHHHHGAAVPVTTTKSILDRVRSATSGGSVGRAVSSQDLLLRGLHGEGEEEDRYSPTPGPHHEHREPPGSPPSIFRRDDTKESRLTSTLTPSRGGGYDSPAGPSTTRGGYDTSGPSSSLPSYRRQRGSYRGHHHHQGDPQTDSSYYSHGDSPSYSTDGSRFTESNKGGHLPHAYTGFVGGGGGNTSGTETGKSTMATRASTTTRTRLSPISTITGGGLPGEGGGFGGRLLSSPSYGTKATTASHNTAFRTQAQLAAEGLTLETSRESTSNGDAGTAGTLQQYSSRSRPKARAFHPLKTAGAGGSQSSSNNTEKILMRHEQRNGSGNNASSSGTNVGCATPGSTSLNWDFSFTPAFMKPLSISEL